MTKNQVRQLKSHFGIRWAEFRHWQKTKQHCLCLENKFILSATLPGPVLALDCLGEVYQGIIDIDTDNVRNYNTMLLVNNMVFKYKTVEQLADLILQCKLVAHRLIVNFNSALLIYDRLALTPAQVVDQLEHRVDKDFVTHKKIVLNTIPNHGFGNVFLSLDRKHG
jgi:hypothetical protein